MKGVIGVLSVILLMVQTMNAQSFFENVSQHKWKGSGELMESAASFKMEWQPVLDGKFYKLTFQNQRDESKEYIFKSMGVYRPKTDGTFTGTWFDSRGYSFPLEGNFTENELTVHWGDFSTEEGKTVYSINEDGTIAVMDYILKDGNLVSFGMALYNKL